jgi:hypothetical protein
MSRAAGVRETVSHLNLPPNVCRAWLVNYAIFNPIFYKELPDRMKHRLSHEGRIGKTILHEVFGLPPVKFVLMDFSKYVEFNCRSLPLYRANQSCSQCQAEIPYRKDVSLCQVHKLVKVFCRSHASDLAKPLKPTIRFLIIRRGILIRSL